MKRLYTILAIIAAIYTTPAFAAIYNVNENFTGTFYNNPVLTGFSSNHNLVFASLNSGDASLFSHSLNTIVNGTLDPATNTATCTGVCNFTENLINGDRFFGTEAFTSLIAVNHLVFYTGTSMITGGTGLFLNATGTGTFSGVDDLLTGKTRMNVTYSITTPDIAAVPEPETNAMLLAGLVLIGFVTRRNQPA